MFAPAGPTAGGGENVALLAPTRARHLLHLLDGDGRSADERARLVDLIELLADLPAPPDPLGLYLDYPRVLDALHQAMVGEDGERLEEAFLELYCHLHGYEAPYTAEERDVVDSTGGYWCHAGGLSPILKAPPFMPPSGASIDYGAGNGLQLLLLEKLAPHRHTVQVEISSRMIEAGRALQRWLGIGEERVEWVQADVAAVPPAGFEFIYLYRPVRPDGPGGEFYRRFAEVLARKSAPVVIFSVADCLRPFLPAQLETFYSDGHLTCYRRKSPPVTPAGPGATG